MATSDGESCSAEDRALGKFECEPWGDVDGDEGSPWTALEESIEQTRQRFVARYQEAFRAGFRAGQEHQKQPGAELPGIVERELRGYIREIHARLDGFTAPANSPLGVELSKIRDRLNALPHTTAERALAIYSNFGRRFEELSRRLDALEAWRQFSAKELDRLRSFVDSEFASMRSSLDAIEESLRLQEPIG